jgi:hypothetical protein
MTRYTIRFRCRRGATQTALIVEDQEGAAYLFQDGRLQQLTDRVAPEGLARTLEWRTPANWTPVPPVASYTLDELGYLMHGVEAASR